MNDLWGSHTKVYLPFFSFSFHVTLVVAPTDVFLSMPGPFRWKLWIDDLSEILKMYVPAFSFETFLPPFVRVIVNPGPSVPTSVGGPASARGTASTPNSATVAAIATNFMVLL